MTSNKYRTYITSKEWRRKSEATLNMVYRRDVLLPFLRATHAHHMTYHNLGHEIPLRDTVGLNKHVHKWLVHNPLLWKTPARLLVNWVLRGSAIFWMLALAPFAVLRMI